MSFLSLDLVRGRPNLNFSVLLFKFELLIKIISSLSSFFDHFSEKTFEKFNDNHLQYY